KTVLRDIDTRLPLDQLSLLLNEKWKLDLRSADRLSTAREEVAREADEVAQLADKAAMYRDQAYGLAGIAHAEAADPDSPEQERRHRQEALAKLTRAVELSSAGDWRWRYELAQQLAKAMRAENDETVREAHRTKALQVAREALAGHGAEAKEKE